MSECIICHEEINYELEDNKYTFNQSCSCFYNAHQECLKNWLNVKSLCIICGQGLYYTKTHRPFKQDKKRECCVLL